MVVDRVMVAAASTLMVPIFAFLLIFSIFEMEKEMSK